MHVLLGVINWVFWIWLSAFVWFGLLGMPPPRKLGRWFFTSRTQTLKREKVSRKHRKEFRNAEARWQRLARIWRDPRPSGLDFALWEREFERMKDNHA